MFPLKGMQRGYTYIKIKQVKTNNQDKMLKSRGEKDISQRNKYEKLNIF